MYMFLVAGVNIITHITSQENWKKAREKGNYINKSLEDEGFIHCSTLEQVPGVANALFKGVNGLVLLYINERKLESGVIYEDLYDTGIRFPHVYGPINLEAVERVRAFQPGPDGQFELPVMEAKQMKTIGLLGGMSWESTLEYYRLINEEVKYRLGKAHSAKCLLYSFDFQAIEVLQHQEQWEKLSDVMVEKASAVKTAGADFIAICTNTMHIMAPDIEENTGLEVLHIADATGKQIVNQGLTKVALLGTKFTMEGTFYSDRLKNRYAIDVMVPTEDERETIHQVIYDELVKGVISDKSRKQFVAIINRLSENGAEGVILGCTEIPLLIKQVDVSIPVFSTTHVHAKAIALKALCGD